MMYAIIISFHNVKYYFGGWEGSDSDPSTPETTFWRRRLDDVETYEYSDPAEAALEIELICSSKFKNVIGLPDDFEPTFAHCYVAKVRQGHDE